MKKLRVGPLKWDRGGYRARIKPGRDYGRAVACGTVLDELWHLPTRETEIDLVFSDTRPKQEDGVVTLWFMMDDWDDLSWGFESSNPSDYLYPVLRRELMNAFKFKVDDPKILWVWMEYDG